RRLEARAQQHALPETRRAARPRGRDPARAGAQQRLPGGRRRLRGEARPRVHRELTGESVLPCGRVATLGQDACVEKSLRAGSRGCGTLAPMRRGTAPGGSDRGWHQLQLPLCFDGRVASIAVDDDELIALDRSRRIFTMDNALKDASLFNWTSRWGTPFWTGPGYQLPDGIVAWSWSVV